VPWQAEIPVFEDFKESCRKVAEEVLESSHEICGKYPVATNFEIAVGKPAEVLARLAQSKDADLIVVGTRGHSSVVGLLLGSVTQRLLHIASVPVLAVPPARVGKMGSGNGEKTRES
jgi:nucleotide-binding universal stress UspA family protein